MRKTLIALAVFLAACDGSGASTPDAAVHVGSPDAAIDARSLPPDAPTVSGTVCTNKVDNGALIYTCNYQWQTCSAGADREVDCHIQAAGSLRFSLCDCKIGGVSQMQFTSTTVCAQTSWAALETIVNQQCQWDLK